MKRKSGIARFAVALVMAIIMFVALLFVQSNIKSGSESVNVLVASKTISARTEITKKNYTDYFKVEGRIKEQLPENAIKENDLKDTETLIVNQDIPKNVVLDKTYYTSEKDFLEYLGDGIVEVGISASSVANADCGTLRRGDIVDLVSTYSADDGVAKTITIKNVIIKNAYDGAGAEVTDNKTASTVFKILVSTEQSEKLNAALKLTGNSLSIIKTSDVKYKDNGVSADVQIREILLNDILD